MTELTPGTKVHVEMSVDAEIVNWTRASSGEPTHYYVKVPGDDWTSKISVPVSAITVLAPPNWPPQVGDVWRAGDVEYYARKYAGGSGTVMLTAFNPSVVSALRNYADGEFDEGPHSLDKFKALHPVLKYRAS
jgi:hypothetical protein